ncbi:hypothetical protein KSF_078250 [Reticulibacter mediterranei]|uniref:Uncharacterized protein n=1 Tax=Reticulibacter mediterranei TaxID=2778369 RepID=A0A8J3N436_9CHLR|nr:hypothetical protein [Reticulibacter mediterranei]GHO97777.1 hypothetical protein KSF_078250 [Reticulibacter mediterranei]
MAKRFLEKLTPKKQEEQIQPRPSTEQGSDQRRDGSDDKKKSGSQGQSSDFYKLGHRESKKKQERQEKRAQLEQKHKPLKEETDSNSALEIQKINEWEQTGPRTHAKSMEADALRSRVSAVYKERSQANASFEENLRELDQLAERDDQKSLSKTLKKPFSEEMSYDERFSSAEAILEATQAANTASWKNLAKEMAWKRERHDRTSQIEKRANLVNTILTDLGRRATESSRSALGNIDAWKQIDPRGDLAEILRGEVKALYDRYNRASQFQAQQHELGKRHFSAEDMRANRDLTVREGSLTEWEGRLHTLETGYEREWNALHQRLRKPVQKALETKQTALRERLDDLTDSINDYRETKLEKITARELTHLGEPDTPSLVKRQRERVQALLNTQNRDVQANNARFEQVLQKFDNIPFTPEDMRTNRDLSASRDLFNMWENHIAALEGIHAQEREYLSASLALERGEPVVPSTNAGGESVHNTETREQRVQAIVTQRSQLSEQLTSLRNNVRAYYQREREQHDSPRESVQALYDIQIQDVQATTERFERALRTLDERRFRAEDRSANRDLIASENLLRTWKAYIAALESLHAQEREYLNASLAQEQNQTIETRQQRVQAIVTQRSQLSEQLTSLRNSVRAYYQHEREQHDSPRARVRSLHAIHTRDIRDDSASFKQALQTFDKTSFSAEDMRANRDLIASENLLRTWKAHTDKLAAIQQARREYVSNSLALEQDPSRVSSTNAGENEQTREARDQRIAALRQRFIALTSELRAYSREQASPDGSPIERVVALHGLQRQDVRADNASFEQALQTLRDRPLTNETTYNDILNTWENHIAVLESLHQQERGYLSASLALERS